MSTGDIYPRPSRERIAERAGVPETLPIPISHYCDSGNCEVCGDGTGDEPQPEETRGPLANFSVHLSARMRARGWDQAQLQKHAGISPIIAAKAINGTGCDLALAGKLAELVGGYLASMIGPYLCGTCHGEPPAGFACLECGTEARTA